jgi:hypothetical protein
VRPCFLPRKAGKAPTSAALNCRGHPATKVNAI